MAALLILVFGFLPVANWIEGGHAFPQYGLRKEEWLSGSLIVVGGAAVLAILSRRVGALWKDGMLSGVGDGYAAHSTVVAAFIAVGAFVAYSGIAQLVFSGRPLLIDEIVQVFQAQIFAEGRLWRPAAPHPEFFSTMHVVETQGRVYGQFPAGGPAMLLLGTVVGATWLVGPLFGAVSVTAFHSFLRFAEHSPRVRLGATLLFATAPFVLFMSGSHMNHVTALAWILVAIAALARIVSSERVGWLTPVLLGLGLGVAATIRPTDALAFALPAGVWLVVRALRDKSRWRDVLLSGIAIVVPVALLLWVNSQTTGSALRFGYIEMWGKSHELGFHETPWGPPHTPMRGLELVSLIFLRLQTYLFETPIPSLLPAAAALALAPKLKPLDRYLLVSGALVVLSYFAYWHDGFFLGPRFVYPLAPILVLWTARLPGLVERRFGRGTTYRAVIFGGLIAMALGAAWSLPIRARQYRNGLLTMRWNADSAATASGVENALVLVRESWGSEILARLWERQVPRTDAERLYRTVDACRLFEGLDSLERSGVSGTAALTALQPLKADSALLVRSPFSPDTTERMLPGSTYTERCAARIVSDTAGFTLLAPLLIRQGSNVYARDMHARDSLLLAQYPDRPVFLLKPATSEEGDVPRFWPVRRDSLKEAWSAESHSRDQQGRRAAGAP